MTENNSKASQGQEQSELAEKAAKVVEIVNSNATQEERQSAIWEILVSLKDPSSER